MGCGVKKTAHRNTTKCVDHSLPVVSRVSTTASFNQTFSDRRQPGRKTCTLAPHCQSHRFFCDSVWRQLMPECSTCHVGPSPDGLTCQQRSRVPFVNIPKESVAHPELLILVRCQLECVIYSFWSKSARTVSVSHAPPTLLETVSLFLLAHAVHTKGASVHRRISRIPGR